MAAQRQLEEYQRIWKRRICDDQGEMLSGMYGYSSQRGLQYAVCCRHRKALQRRCQA